MSKAHAKAKALSVPMLSQVLTRHWAIGPANYINNMNHNNDWKNRNTNHLNTMIQKGYIHDKNKHNHDQLFRERFYEHDKMNE